MPSTSQTTSPLTGEPTPPYYIHASDAFFQDARGRRLLLRGVNFSSASKAPLSQPSHRVEGFWDRAEAGGDSFVGQPLDLDDGSADVHLARLRSWGFNCLRYVFTWEALEHEGPRRYDDAYMDYVVAVLRKIKQYGFRVFMDPHQDLFSRFTGGSGAPYWVLLACGLNPRNFTVTQAAFVHCEWPTPEAPRPEEFPAMLWATNYTRLAAATLSILFFAGRRYAPRCVIDGDNIQDWLQRHFLDALERLARRVADAGDLLDECVIGWDSINEPNPTYIGLEDLGVLPEKWKLRKGPTPTPLQSMRLGVGQRQKVQHYVFKSLGPKRDGDVEVDPQGKSAWLSREDDARLGGARWGWKRHEDWPLGECVWAAHGVWDPATGELLRPDYFLRGGGGGSGSGSGDGTSASGSPSDKPADFVAEYWLPYWRKNRDVIRSVHREAIMFLQPPVFEPPPTELTPEDLSRRACVSCHFYDGLTLITKHWNWFNADAVGLLRGRYSSVLGAVRVGNAAIRKCMRDQLGYLRQDTLDVLGRYPTLVGEIGTPYDLDGRKAYYGDGRGRGIGDYASQRAALDASLNACDGTNLLSYTAWCYNPHNSHKWGDEWNGEDFSFWSRDDVQGGDGARERVGASLAPPTLARDASQATLATVSAGRSKAGETTPRVLLAFRQTPGEAASTSTAAMPPPPVPEPGDLLRLNDGARALTSFCRPYPVSTIGTPVSIDFDARSSTLTYVVDVDAEDLQRAEEAHAAGHPIATEVYAPFAHYASDEALNRGAEQMKRRALADRRDLDGGVPSLGASSSTLQLSNTKDGDAELRGNAEDADDDGATGNADGPAELLSLDVRLQPPAKTSRTMHTAVRGQTLFWYLHAAPSGAARRRPSERDGDGDLCASPGRYTLVVRRRGGALPVGAIPNAIAGRDVRATAGGASSYDDDGDEVGRVRSGEEVRADEGVVAGLWRGITQACAPACGFDT